MLLILLSFCSIFIPISGHICRPGSLYSAGTGKCHPFTSATTTLEDAKRYCANVMGRHLQNTAYGNSAYGASGSGGGCRPGWLHFAPARSCYKVIYNVNWDEGELACQREGAHLASIHSEAENQFLLGATKQNAKCDYDNQIWIGLRNRNPGRAPHSSYFSWSDSSQKGFTRYNMYEPNNANDVEYCVQLCNMPGCNNGYDKTWNDYTCSKRLRAAICKKPEGR